MIAAQSLDVARVDNVAIGIEYIVEHRVVGIVCRRVPTDIPVAVVGIESPRIEVSAIA